MKLTKIRITNFRSVEDSGEFDLNQTLCLVGKNEAGKTAILHALAGLNPHPKTSITFDVERDYPRRYLNDYADRHNGEQAVVVTTAWDLTEDEITGVAEQFGAGSLKHTSVHIQRRYNSKSSEWDIPIDYKQVINFLIDDEELSNEDRKPLDDVSNTQTLRAALEGITERSDNQQRLLDRINGFSGKTISGAIKEVLSSSLPFFMYFSHYDRMDGQIRLDTFEARKRGETNSPVEAGEQVFVDFLEYAGTSIKEITSATTYEWLTARCEAASNRITDQLLEYWSQNPNIEIDVRVTKAEPKDPPPFNDGIIARARVKNNIHRVTVPFSERSAGFIWFFSFLVKFAQVRKDGGELILLLDEPGLTLHGKAQADLLRYFEEKLAPYHQVIFTTHSPFMVPPDDLPSVRIVEDHITTPRPGVWVSEGTKVRDDTLATDRDTLFPLQGALGYEITQTLFVGKHTLLVEGPGDILYLQAWSSALERRGRQGLDRRWTICPAGGIDKIQPFVALFAGAKLDIAALTDYAKGDKRKIDNLRQNKILEGDRLLTFAHILGADEADVEDVMTPKLYLTVINQAFELSTTEQLTIKGLNEAGPETSRLVKKVEACFRVLPATVDEFDHYRPADWLFRNPKVLDGKNKDVTETLDRAEQVIIALNKLLPSK